MGFYRGWEQWIHLYGNRWIIELLIFSSHLGARTERYRTPQWQLPWCSFPFLSYGSDSVTVDRLRITNCPIFRVSRRALVRHTATIEVRLARDQRSKITSQVLASALPLRISASAIWERLARTAKIVSHFAITTPSTVLYRSPLLP